MFPFFYLGVSAYHINGKTLHSAFGLNPQKIYKELSILRRDKLTQQLKREVLFIIDERGMLSSEILGACERNLKECIYDGLCQDQEFGGIPVVLLIGDDFQLPPIVIQQKGKGAFFVYSENKASKIHSSVMLDEARGIQLFKKLSKRLWH